MTSHVGLDYIELWAEDLRRKGFSHVEVVLGTLAYIKAVRPDKRDFRGFVASVPNELDINLRQAIEDAAEENCISFLVVPFDLLESAQSTVITWRVENKVNLEGTI